MHISVSGAEWSDSCNTALIMTVKLRFCIEALSISSFASFIVFIPSRFLHPEWDLIFSLFCCTLHQRFQVAVKWTIFPIWRPRLRSVFSCNEVQLSMRDGLPGERKIFRARVMRFFTFPLFIRYWAFSKREKALNKNNFIDFLSHMFWCKGE